MLRTQSAQKLMQQFGTSYYYATLFFPEDIKRDVFTLYKFVRVADEIVDDCQGDKLDIHYQNAAQELSDLRNNFFAALDRQDIQEVNF
ncbi:squalene/phytoene synthase family protein [Patescibacteria group bacterium]|nr:squalene/phytoene synthase family protein [Patescibacteria group bacterium]MBP7841908.1 squalene/phytoene synthase family protein [Patescibacteria group bacterium]